ncbi:glycoside hydrolase family 18 [uncultured Bacteroides sp.]|uniref:glycoside hydrolase family 18 n=1 Tax=uncultured Bacteroides sp. TaxID=162156 RepID=UPI00280AC2EF|nr:glycoside hydrolase family 18 [uncultured Bacteroides sp.]
MKVLKRLLYMIPLVGMIFTSCTDVERLDFEHIGGYNTMNNGESEAYYANLRAYKETANDYNRPVAFGWFSNWAPAGVIRKGYLSSVPDSMDIVSMWSGAPGRYEITEAQKEDKEFVQKVKGIKLLEVSLLSHLGKGRTPERIYEEVEKQAEEEGWSADQLKEAKKKIRWEFWGYTSGDPTADDMKEALIRFAKALCDSLVVNDWDGFDIDWEPIGGFNDKDGTLTYSYLDRETYRTIYPNIMFLVKEMGKYIGPKSDPEGKGHKLLVIDGYISDFDAEIDEYVDYWITQSYSHSSPDQTPLSKNYKKLIITENFESSASDGGQLLGQARWMPQEGYKGGVGAYRFDNDYGNNPDYKWMRQAIQINQQVFNEWKDSQKTVKPEEK